MRSRSRSRPASCMMPWLRRCVPGRGGEALHWQRGRSSHPLFGTHARVRTGRGDVDGLWTEVCGQQKQSNDPGNNQHILNTPIIGRRWHANGTSRRIQLSPNTPTTGLRERGNDTSRRTGRSGRQNAATRRNMRREERATAQGPVKKQQRDGMSHRGWGFGGQ